MWTQRRANAQGEAMQRRLVQIHLSTAIVMMLSASGTVWMNLQPHTKPEPRVSDYSSRIEYAQAYLAAIFDGTRYGWPFQFYRVQPIETTQGYLNGVLQPS